MFTGETVRIDFQLDKAMPPNGADRRELGIIVLNVGLERSEPVQRACGQCRAPPAGERRLLARSVAALSGALLARLYGLVPRGRFRLARNGLYIQNFRDFLLAMFGPKAQGTIRPLSERAFFMRGSASSAWMPCPSTSSSSLRSSPTWRWWRPSARGSPAAGRDFSRLFSGAQRSGIEPLGWACVYNQVMCGFFLLLAFHFLLRYVETGARRYNLYQWVAFLLGFGALELNVVYPAIAAAYTLLCISDGPRRKYFRTTLPMFAVSIAYALAHHAAAASQNIPGDAMHFTGAMFRTLGTYWTWSVGPTFLFTPFYLPKWLMPTGIALVSAGLLGFLAWKLRAGARVALLCLVWYLALLAAPVLPLRDHQTEYYVFLPVIGLCWLGAWAAVSGWRAECAAAR